MEIQIKHNNLDWIFIIDDFEYIPEEKETGPTYSSGGEPGFPEMIEINEYHLELAPKIFCKKLTCQINTQLQESDKLANYILAFYEDIIYEKALETYNEDEDYYDLP